MNTAVDRLRPCRIFAVIITGMVFFSGCRGPEVTRTLAGGDNDYPSATTAYRPPTGAFDMRGANQPPAAGVARPQNPVQRVQFVEPPQPVNVALQPPPAARPPQTEELPEPLPLAARETIGREPYAIDLSTALALAGANNLQIAFAAERVNQAVAQMDQADVLWVPSLNAGLVYNNHAGRIQATEGEVIEASRNSLFVGAGAGFGDSPLNAGSGGPARMFVDLPLVDVLFEPLAARQFVQAAEANQGATFNDTLLQVSIAYLNLLAAQSQVAIVEETVTNAEELARITGDFARAGEGLQADAERAQAELNDRRRESLRAKETVAAASAELVRLLRLDPAVILVPTDGRVAPVDVVDADVPLRDLIGQALAARPEIARQGALIDETWFRMRQEQWRPWMPHLYAGFSGGGFGGAPGGDVKSFSDRTDFDVAAIWELQNFGLGNAARIREQRSAHLQAHIAADQFRDLVASEVSRTYHQIGLRRDQIGAAQAQVAAASQALALNFDGIRNKTLRPIEAQQAISALAAARSQYLASVIDYNRVQFELLRALGVPPAATLNDVVAQ